MREADIQRAVYEFVKTVAPNVFIYAIPNSAVRKPGGRAGNAVPGLTAGIPDLGLVLPDGRAAFWEVKTDKTTLSPVQGHMCDSLITAGIPYAIVRSIDDARRALSEWGVVTRENSYARRTAASSDPLPDWDDLRGRAPDATGGLSSEAFIRKIRDEW